MAGGYATLQDASGKDLGRTMLNKRLEVGEVVSLGGKEVEIDSVLSKEDYLAGRPFLRVSKADAIDAAPAIPLPVVKRTGFKTPLLSTSVLPQKKPGVPTPRHDPKAENALVMPRLAGRNVPVYVWPWGFWRDEELTGR